MWGLIIKKEKKGKILHLIIKIICKQIGFTFTFTFMHLADAFIQSDLQCIQAIHFYQYIISFEPKPFQLYCIFQL